MIILGSVFQTLFDTTANLPSPLDLKIRPRKCQETSKLQKIATVQIFEESLTTSSPKSIEVGEIRALRYLDLSWIAPSSIVAFLSMSVFLYHSQIAFTRIIHSNIGIFLLKHDSYTVSNKTNLWWLTRSVCRPLPTLTPRKNRM